MTNDFASSDTLTIGGLKLLNLVLCRAGTEKLELDFDGDGARDVYDAYALNVGVLWAGGSYDGWDRTASAEYLNVYQPAATVIMIR